MDEVDQKISLMEEIVKMLKDANGMTKEGQKVDVEKMKKLEIRLGEIKASCGCDCDDPNEYIIFSKDVKNHFIWVVDAHCGYTVLSRVLEGCRADIKFHGFFLNSNDAIEKGVEVAQSLK